ncbi:OmpA family protein [Lacihabitans sp. CCS-44]|uniref:OmpA family protein n=1 Tax=Lacihabitans sp. CCS-44 TaxID=2487331 RepID=UPI0020CF9C81|nr:OmpA family protein [Lacihabitans sp. CCS-44]MCP9754869.1 OmpA family protein [Lacihabitans sp. CCS-44]
MSNAFCSFSKITFKSFFAKEILTLFLILSVTATFSQKVNISGSFWDDSNGVDLNSTVYGFVAGEKVKLGETDRKQRFNFELPTLADSLVFESIGYNSVSIPVNFVGSFKNQSSANLSINSKGGHGQFQQKDIFVFCKSSTQKKGMTYGLYNIKNDSLFQSMDFTTIIDRFGSFSFPIAPRYFSKKLKVIGKMVDNDVVLNIDLKASNGFTFIDLNIYPSEKKTETEAVLATIKVESSKDSKVTNLKEFESLPYPTFGSRNLYFDQSKFELKSENRLILDSLAIYLQQKMNARINVSGYTDNVGKETLNTILAKYRTQVVANYLKNKGVAATQIDLDWENHNSESKKATEELNKFRKVVIEEIN